MNRIQAGEGSAIDATRPITDAASPEHDWIIEIYKPAVDGRFQETVAKDLGREADVREILGWLNTEGWIVLKNIGEVEHEWDVSRDRYVNRIIISARLLTNEDLVTRAPHQFTLDKAPISDTPVCLRCIFFAGDNSSLWNVKIARKRAGEQGDALETVNVVGGDVFICHSWLKKKPPHPVIDHPGPLLPGSLKSWNTFQNDYVWIPQKDND